jgi:hypothetical protein
VPSNALAWLLALGATLGPVPTPAEGQSASQAATDAEKEQKKRDRLAEPWPDVQQLAKRQAAAENLPLFRTHEPLELTLAADFDAVNKDRTVDSTQRFPGVLTVAAEGGQPVAVPVQIGTRGNLRLSRRVCSFVPLRIEFSKKQAKGTPFEGQGSLKLVTHCENSNDYEQRVLGEALAYRIANLVTPASYRIRLARATYVDSSSDKTLTTRWAIFIEDADDVARRLQGRIAPLRERLFHHIDQPSLLRLAVFQFGIGNTDYSIHALHNVRLVQDSQGVLRPIAYDFDVSGLVDPPYGAPSPKMRLRSLRDRLYRGPCLPVEDLEPVLAEFRGKQTQILALYDAEPAMDRKQREAAQEYLRDFFDIIGSPRRTKTYFVDRCRPVAGM